MEQQLEFNFDLYAIGPWIHEHHWWCRHFLYLARLDDNYDWTYDLLCCICDDTDFWSEGNKLVSYVYNQGSGGRAVPHNLKTLDEVKQHIDKLLPTMKFSHWLPKKSEL